MGSVMRYTKFHINVHFNTIKFGWPVNEVLKV